MKKIFLLTCTVLCLFFSLDMMAQSCPIPTPINTADAVGTWKGTLSWDGELKPFTLKINQRDGSYLAEINIPFHSAKDIKTNTRVCESEEFHIGFVVGNAEYELRGRPDGESMSGKLIAMDNSSEDELFVLKKQG